MRVRAAAMFGCLGGVLSCATAAAATEEPGAAVSVGATGGSAVADDRLLFVGSVSHIPNVNAGLGGQVYWLHDFSSAAKFNIGIERNSLGDGDWTVGSVSGAFIHSGTTTSPRQYGLNGEIHQGSGSDSVHSFKYQVLAGGLSYALTRRLTVQLEERYINVDTSHGHLPKFGLAFTADPRWLATVSYAHSAFGDLRTELFAARIDVSQSDARLLAGVALGKAAPAVANLQPSLSGPGQNFRVLYCGVARQFTGRELQLVADFLDLGGIRRLTLTASYMVHLRH